MIEFRLPALGADMDEGTLLEWKVKPGERVKKGQVIAIVDTAKAAIDVECWQEGIVERLIAEPGQKMPVGTLMAILREEGEKLGAGGTAPSAPQPAPTAAERRRISPAARKRAAELGVDLAQLSGSGPDGAVTLEDVEKAAAAAAPAVAGQTAASRFLEMRKTIAAAMSRAKREIPHYYVSEDIPLERMLAWLKAQNAQRPLSERLLPAAVLLKAVAATLKDFPELNGHYHADGYHPAAEVHLGVAIALREGGLVAPALRDADRKPLTQLMQELADLVRRTRAGSLKSSELGAATITVTNLGDQGSHGVFGVITPPQVALVGFGRIAERPWAENGLLKAVPLVTASLSADHRVSDGHRGALFLRQLADCLQRPEELAQ